jgi:dipeptidase D
MDNTTRCIINYFEQINRIPRCSKQEHRISQWLRKWATDRQLAVKSDAAGNMVIQVPASPGFEGAPTVILQGHMDMVCEKRADSNHDFTKDPIPVLQDGPWLTAAETTLGADNGIAIALILALMDDRDVVHPPLELFFTVDEETGLTGALKMDPALLSGRILINLDSEEEGVFVVGCAGGRNISFDRPLTWQPLDDGFDLLGISAQGMKGGHSGVDIAKHRANANKVMTRLLSAGASAAALRLVELKGGTGRNVIPRGCEALVACRRDQVEALEQSIGACADVIKQEYRTADPGLSIQISHKGRVPSGFRGITENDSAVVLNLLAALPSGPVEMAEAVPLLVETSVNLSIVEIKKEALTVISSQRSSVPSRLDAVCLAVAAAGRLAGARVHTEKGYPSWPMNRESPLLKRCTAIYGELFAADAEVQIMHAGLECGVIGDRCPGMDMISLGPTLENPHSPSERLFLPSVEKVWRLIVALLASWKP